MIPHTIQIKNFLSYGSETQIIDFTPYHLIYLSGKNGHGKSALLDAITWAIWGQARKVSTASKADPGLLRLGQTQMMVILDFELENNLYRVKREFSNVYGKATTTLEFGMINPTTDEHIPLTDKTIRTTQEKINSTMRLDYNAFINSAFLRQGHANEFSQKSPKERKEILGTILGLQQFDLIKKRALEKAKDAQNKKAALQQLEEKYIQELSKKEPLDKNIQEVHTQLAAVAKNHQQLEKTKKEIDSQKALVAEQLKQYELLAYKLQQTDKELQEKLSSIATTSRRWRSIHSKQLKAPKIDTLQQERTALHKKIMLYQKQLQDSLTIKEALLKTQTELQEKKNIVHQQIIKQKNALNIEHQKVDLAHAAAKKTYNELETKKKLLSQETKNIDPAAVKKAELLFEKRKLAYQQFITDGKWYCNEQKSLDHKNKLVLDDDPSCPLCEQNLSAARRKFLKNKFAKQERFIAHRVARLGRIVTKLKPMLIQEHAQLEQNKLLVQKINELTQLEKQIIQHTQACAGFEKEAAKHLAALQSFAKKENELVLGNDELKKITARLTDLQKQLQNITYNQKDHQAAQTQLQHIEKIMNEQQELQQQIMLQSERKTTINTAIAQAKKLKKECQQFADEKKKFDTIAKQQQELKTREAQYAKQMQEISAQKESLLQQQGSLQNQHKNLLSIQAELKKQESIINDLNQIIEDYQTIASATGKDGIQALLIEQAIPEIEQEANELLSKLTNNQAQIFIESLRDLKKGGSKETLDIKISDPSGIRPYELFSGGEAFRIDFSLRIAISKLLARRAGTALQTLIIDEGFGSQDEEGLGHIMDAIYKIQDDFEKVIVVSHLPSMKDQFPVHFMVEKGATGSSINVVEQG